MRKLLLLFAVLIGSVGIAAAQSERKAKSPKKVVTTTNPKPAAATPAPQSRVQAPVKAPEAASSLFEATKADRKKQN